LLGAGTESRLMSLRWLAALPLTMRRSHGGGEKMFVDYAGDKVPVVVVRRTGEVRDAHIFVAVMGGARRASGRTPGISRLRQLFQIHYLVGLR